MSIANFISDTVGLWKRPSTCQVDRDDGFPNVADAPPDSRRLIRDRRYCRVLSSGQNAPFDDVSIGFAWQAAHHEMAMIPQGEVFLDDLTARIVASRFEIGGCSRNTMAVDSLYLDRNCVTNADYARFVHAGGYGNPNLWPEETLPNVLQFLDRTGQPGPKYWTDGAPPKDRLDHPVVGVCWYEANAYATWVGKRLPSTEEWQRAGTWGKSNQGTGSEQRYPWGDGFVPSKANLWAGGRGDTAPVDAYPDGATANGVNQLIGNVWEWVDAQFALNDKEGVTIHLDDLMAEIRGGAFDTYFASQATCQFRTGQPLLHRGGNVGFRCCISCSVLPANS